MSAQSDDSLHWIILGKPPTKQNLAAMVLFLVHASLLRPPADINPSFLKHTELVSLGSSACQVTMPFLEQGRIVSTAETCLERDRSTQSVTCNGKQHKTQKTKLLTLAL